MPTVPQRAGRTRYFALGLMPASFVGLTLAACFAAPLSSRAGNLSSQIAFGMFFIGALLSILGAAAGLAFASHDLSRERAALAGVGYGVLSSTIAALYPRFVGTDYFFMLALFGAWGFAWFCGERFGRREGCRATPLSPSAEA